MALKKRPDLIEKSCIPAIIHIGVTGHRNIKDQNLIRESIRKVVSDIDLWLYENFKNTGHGFVVLTPLAEGSDRIVADEILKFNKGKNRLEPYIEAVFPFNEDEYIKDFNQPGSLKEFKDLKKSARTITIIKKGKIENSEQRHLAFEKTGHYVVNNCDILIAIWDGKTSRGKGGTAEIVKYAGEIGKSYFIINSETGIIEDKWNRDILKKWIKYLDEYNSEDLQVEGLSSSVNNRYLNIKKNAEISGLTIKNPDHIRDDLTLKYERASILAKRYQRRYIRNICLVYILAPIIVALQVAEVLIKLGNMGFGIQEISKIISIVEIILIIIIVSILFITRIKKLHNKWIDYRFLAERIRVAIALSVAGINFNPLKYPANFSISNQKDYWIVKAFSWIWSTKPEYPPITSENIESLKKYLLENWIEDQYLFYARKSRPNKKWHLRLDYFCQILFIITLFITFYHFIRYELNISFLGDDNINVFILIMFFGIIVPAFSSSVKGIEGLYEFKRNSERYEQMKDPLENIIREIKMENDINGLITLLESANDMMLKENQDWRVSILSQKISI
jgi:hypothetical protein